MTSYLLVLSAAAAVLLIGAISEAGAQAPASPAIDGPRAVESHAMSEAMRRFRDALGPMSGALYDERLFKAVD